LGDEEDHGRLIAPIKEALAPAIELVTPIPYTALQQMFDAANPWGLHAYEKALYINELSDEIIETILEYSAKRVSSLSLVPILAFGGAYARVDERETAFGGSRDVKYVMSVTGQTATAEGFEAEREWARQYWSAVVKHGASAGGYVNMMTEYEEERVRNSYGSKYDRLRQIKASYDPDNVFHLNANIPPAS
jgi:Berberine and berberine like